MMEQDIEKLIPDQGILLTRADMRIFERQQMLHCILVCLVAANVVLLIVNWCSMEKLNSGKRCT